MSRHLDNFHDARFITAWDSTQFTASNTGLLVLDRRTYAPNVTAELIITVTLAAAADADNYVSFDFYEAAEKTSTVALTSGTVVAAADMSGWANEGTLDANSLTFPRVNATTMASDILYIQYKGTANCIQVRPTETGTADITCSAVWRLDNGETQHLAASYS